MSKFSCLLSGLLILLTGGGCSLFREAVVSRQDSLRTDSRKVSLDWEVESERAASRVFTYADSSGAEFDVEIVPSGDFTFSAEAGFAGSASVVRLRGKTEASSRGVDSSMEKQHVQSSGSLEQKLKTKTSIKDVQKEKVANNRVLWLLALVAACILFTVIRLNNDVRHFCKSIRFKH